MPLHGLALEGQEYPGGATGRPALDAADGFDSLTGGELAAEPQVGRSVSGRGDEGLRRQNGVAPQGGGEFGLGLGRVGAERQGGSEAEVQGLEWHVQTT